MDKAIVHIKISELEAKEMEDIQLIKDAKIDKRVLIVIYQIDHENKDLDKNLKESE